MAGTPTGLVLALLGEFASDLRESRTIHQLALSSGKAYANVHAVATQLLQEEILIKETVGHSHRCRLNLKNDKTLLYISLLETVKRDALLRENPESRLLLSKVDAHSAKLGVLLAWRREKDLLLVTTTHQPPEHAQELFGMPTTILPLAAFLSDQHLRATIGGAFVAGIIDDSAESAAKKAEQAKEGKNVLLFGHALYASLLREVAR